MEIKGKYNSAKIFTENIELGAVDQIKKLLDHPAFSGTKIRIMPDVHAGAGCVIGFTSTLNGRIVPNLIGVDIGCGVSAINIGKVEINFSDFDRFIREKIPNGRHRNKTKPDLDYEFEKHVTAISRKIGMDAGEQLKGVGSLGGGNHFIEINRSAGGNTYITVHSGSRNFGKMVCEYHQKKGYEYCLRRKDEESGLYNVDKAMSFLEGADAEEYLADLKTAQEYAAVNREKMLDKIVRYLNCNVLEKIESVHNYIDFSAKEPIARKGAISAEAEEKVIIPLNMRDGIIIGVGKGNGDWNNSAPHGAGRLMSRTKAKEELSINDFKNTMKEVWSSCVGRDTIDESPFAYKSSKEIIKYIGDTIDIVDIIKPVYNFKAAE